MLRECRRVLKPGGRIAGYVIHTPAGLSPSQTRRATELGPAYVTASASPDELANLAGLSVTACEDVTDGFWTTCMALLQARRTLEVDLREEEGDDFYEEERNKKETMVRGIDEGLLIRSLTIAMRPVA